MRHFLVAVLGAVAFLSPPAFADVAPLDDDPINSSCRIYEMCRDFASTGTCTTGGDEIVLQGVGAAWIQLDTGGSTSGYTVNLRTCRIGHDSCGVANGVEVFGSDLTESASIGQATGTFQSLFVEVDSNAGGSVDAWLIVCRP